MRNLIRGNSRAFSLAEILVVMVICSVTVIAMMHIVTKKLNANTDINSLKCVKAEFASNLSSTSCLASINNSVYGLSNATKELIYVANNGKTDTEKLAARKVLSASCDRGGEKACEYMVDSCKKDINKCDISASNYDLQNYLALSIDSNSLSRVNIVKYARALYKANNTTIVDEVNNTCCNPGLNVACIVKGITTCPFQYYFDSVAYTTGVGYAIDVDLAGNIYLAGDITGTYIDAFVMKLNKTGTILWQKRIQGTGGVTCGARSIVVDKNGNVFVGGYIANSLDDLLIVKFDNNGTVLWQKVANSTVHSNQEHIFDIAVDSIGNLYITGDTYTGATNLIDILVQKYNSAGTLQWSTTLNSSSNKSDNGTGCAVDSSGNVYITGYSRNASNAYDMVLLKLNTSGTLSWSKRYNSASNAADFGRDIVVDGSGYIYITGDSNNNMVVIKADNAGTILWQKTFNSSFNILDQGFSIDIDNNGYLYVGGRTSNTANQDAFVIKFYNNGDMVWQRRLNSYDDDFDTAWSLAVDKDKQAYIAGYTYISGVNKPFIARMKSEQVNNDTFSEVAETYADNVPAFVGSTTTFTEGGSSLTIANITLTGSNAKFDFK
jgi:hypothetical protein